MNACEVYRALRAQGKGRKKALRLIGCAALLTDDGWQVLEVPKNRRDVERALAAADASVAAAPAGHKPCRHKKSQETPRKGVLLSGAR